MNKGVRNLSIPAILLLGMVACGVSAQPQSGISVQYDKGFLDKYDSQTGTLSRDDCHGGVVKAKASLTDEQQQAILRMARADRFFQLPHELRGVEDGDINTGRFATAPRQCVIAPCWNARLRITEDGKSNEVHWNCGCGNAKPPKEVADIVAALDQAIYGQPAVKAMRPVHCAFY